MVSVGRAQVSGRTLLAATPPTVRVTGTVRAKARANLVAKLSITAVLAPGAPSVAAMPIRAVARRDHAAPARTNSDSLLDCLRRGTQPTLSG